MKHPLNFVSALLLLPQVVLAQPPDTDPSPVSIICDGSYGGHLQGIATDGSSLFWSHTVQLVKTDLKGKKLQRIDVASHHGDLTYHDGKVFVGPYFGPSRQCKRVVEDGKLTRSPDQVILQDEIVGRIPGWS